MHAQQRRCALLLTLGRIKFKHAPDAVARKLAARTLKRARFPKSRRIARTRSNVNLINAPSRSGHIETAISGCVLGFRKKKTFFNINRGK